MKNKKVLGSILIILGIVLFIFGSYISGEVAKGREQISTAQKGVDVGSGVISPFSEDLSDAATAPIQEKIDEGRRDADRYQTLANWLHGSGVVIFVAGIVVLLRSRGSKKK